MNVKNTVKCITKSIFTKRTNLSVTMKLQQMKGENNMIEKYDCVTAITTGATGKGTFVEFENGEVGWISRAILPDGLNVICTVLHIKEDGFPILALDSVQYAAA